EGLDAFDDEFAGPHVSDGGEVVVVDGGVHGGVEEFADGAAGGGQGVACEFGGGQKVPPPPGAGEGVGGGVVGGLGGEGEAVAAVAEAGAGDGGVDGEHEGVEVGVRGAFDEVVGDLALAHDVELEPVAAGGVGGVDVFDGGGAQGGEAEG